MFFRKFIIEGMMGYSSSRFGRSLASNSLTYSKKDWN